MLLISAGPNDLIQKRVSGIRGMMLFFVKKYILLDWGHDYLYHLDTAETGKGHCRK
jgi:hypothetical protein